MNSYQSFLVNSLFSLCAVVIHSRSSELEVFFDGQYGQIEVGGKYVGVEFHHSRPLPSRISFYYPVANSLDFSTDYWTRDESRPFSLLIEHDGKIDSIGLQAFSYYYTPFSVTFQKEFDEYILTILYNFCEDIPVLVYKIMLENKSPDTGEFIVHTKARLVLRTSHTYKFKPATRNYYDNNKSQFIAEFNHLDTDSTLIFISNVAEEPEKDAISIGNQRKLSEAHFSYHKKLKVQQRLEIVQLIGSCNRFQKKEIDKKYSVNWQSSVKKYEERIEAYSFNQYPFSVSDSIHEQTIAWSKAVIASNMHYLDGQFVPMPCPAEYNFFFTHDALLTDLGAVNFDLHRVKNDLLYLKSLTQRDSILPHAYYWKDSKFVTEYCDSDNWNHFWFILLANSYLNHSADLETVKSIYPIIVKSMNLLMQNKLIDNLMYGNQPDWWDIGDIYGAHAYRTILMIETLQHFAAISFRLNNGEDLYSSIELAKLMKSNLVTRLWNDKMGYLMNMLDLKIMDTHYYAGSLLASAFNILDENKKLKLLQTAEKQLLDKNIGIRNVMPADFHLLSDVYNFKTNEVGQPYLYANGGVWPQGTVWYALGLIEAGLIDKANEILKRYLTISGIKNSPHGQPSFYEYRNADQAAKEYGKIDKPTFTWAGGWYLYAVYRLLGVRENYWNIWFNPKITQTYLNPQYTLNIQGKGCSVSYLGEGDHFKSIRMDGNLSHSAIIYRPSSHILLERGIPHEPYLAEANCLVEDVFYDAEKGILIIQIMGIHDQEVELKVITPFSIKQILDENDNQILSYTLKKDAGIHSLNISLKLPAIETSIHCRFDI
jgi:hypothetical protein